MDDARRHGPAGPGRRRWFEPLHRGEVVGAHALGYLEPQGGLASSGSGKRAWLRAAVRYWSEHRRLLAFVLLGAAAASLVGYAVAQNPHAAPAHVATGLRVSLIVSLIAAGTYAQTNTGQARMGMLLVGVGLLASLWLLNGSSRPVLFSIGLLVGGIAPTLFAYLMLAYPSGRLRSGTERRLLVGAGGALFVFWTFLVLTSAQPPLKTPLLACAPRCPTNAFFIDSSGASALAFAKAGAIVAWGMLALGTPVLLSTRLRSAAEPLRRSFVPVEMTAVASAVALFAFLAARIIGSKTSSALGAAYVETAVLVPLTIVAGLFVERLSMGRALATFVRRLAEHPDAAPEVMLARALKDPTVEIAYLEPRTGRHVDAAGRPMDPLQSDERRAVARIERGGEPLAMVSYDAGLSDQAAFVEAAGAVALMHVEAARLEADLTESNKELVASRLRLVEAADGERQRIERDLHDGVQQYILGLRLKLDLVAEAMRDDPARGEQMIATIGRRLDDLLGALRSLAAGIYPAVLTERGLKDALESVVRNAPQAIHLHTSGLRRYPEDVEVAVYFSCLEAIQNVVKHAGSDANAKMRVWQVGDALAFDVHDSGVGFDAQESDPGSGLINMRDRIEAVGGKLWVSSQPGRGTWVRGRVPLG